MIHKSDHQHFHFFLLAIVPFFLCITQTQLSAQGTEDSLTAALKAFAQQTDLPGFAVAIVSGEKVLYQKGFGYADRKKETAYTIRTIQNIGSVSKTVVGVALVKAIEAGALTMETPINDILPFTIVNPYHPETPILVRHLASHTSSILDSKYYGQTYISDGKPENEDGMAMDYYEFIHSHERMELGDFLKKILNKEGKWHKKKNFLKQAPGTVQEYTNLNAALAAYLIELATGIPFESFTKEQIFSPLGMTSSAWSRTDLNAEAFASLYFPRGDQVPYYSLNTYPDGGLLSTVADMSAYLSEVIKAFQSKSRYLPQTSSNLLLPGDEDDNRAFWGMGSVSRLIGHDGSDPGMHVAIRFHADTQIGRVVFTNVNAEDNDELWEQFRELQKILTQFETRL
ncbi:MAG: serine hydrolase [Bacteroidota bacterium]